MIDEKHFRRQQQIYKGESFARKLYWQLAKITPLDWAGIVLMIVAALICWHEYNN